MASSDADDAQAGLAEAFREAARYLERNHRSDAEFREGVEWAVDELQTLADYIANDPR